MIRAAGGREPGVRTRTDAYYEDIDTDVLAPGRYMKGPVEAAAPHCLESVDPDFAGQVAPGDFVIGGGNFGLGSSREQAAQVLRILGVNAVIAKSFGGIFSAIVVNPAISVARQVPCTTVSSESRSSSDLVRAEATCSGT